MKNLGLIAPLLVVLASAPAFATSSLSRATSYRDTYESVLACNSRSRVTTSVHRRAKPAKTPWESTWGVLSNVWDLMHGLETLRLVNELPLGELQKINPSILRFTGELSLEPEQSRDLVDDFQMVEPSIKKSTTPKISPNPVSPSRLQPVPLSKPS